MSLVVTAHVPERGVQLDLEVPSGRTTALVGPNGAGKSTLLALVGGMLRPRSGRILLEDRVLVDIDDGRARTWVPPYAREVATLSQDPMLFPHLSALGNIMFGLRARGVPRRRARAEATVWLEQIGLADLASRKPSQLSGGQAQRVAIARALATEPRLLLLDEPLAALDIDVAPFLREQLRRFLDGRTALVVTHDVLDALTLAQNLAVIESGHLIEHGPTSTVLTRPHSAFAARFAGLNLLGGIWDGHRFHLGSGTQLRSTRADGPGIDQAGADMHAAFRPSAVTIVGAETAPSEATVLTRTVSALEPRDDVVRVRAEEIAADVSAQQVAELALVPGATVHLAVSAPDVAIYPVRNDRG